MEMNKLWANEIKSSLSWNKLEIKDANKEARYSGERKGTIVPRWNKIKIVKIIIL